MRESKQLKSWKSEASRGGGIQQHESIDLI
jgi:hypothetical protein